MSEYIDRAALKRELAPYEENDFSQQMDVILAIVDAQPAADVATVRHGTWIHPHWRNDVSAANCSECGAEAQHREYRGVQKYYKVCPSCGARMDKETEHEAD